MARVKRFSLPQLVDDGLSALVVLDGEFRIRSISAGMQKLTGWSGDDLEYRTCQHGAPKTPAAEDLITSALAPPASVREGSIAIQEAVLPHRSGTALRVQLYFIPLRNDQDQTSGVLIAAERQVANTVNISLPSVSRQLHAEINALRLDLRRRFQTDSYIGQCAELRKALRQAALLRTTRSHFVIAGAAGTGRRHLARMVHGGSTSSTAVCAVLDCHLLPIEDLLTTLHQLRSAAAEKSALPHQQTGLLILAEVHQMPVEAQLWLLEHYDLNDGSLWLAATTSQPECLHHESEQLLPDLASSLSTVEIQLPPLHARGDDVLLLSQLFLQENQRDRHTVPETLAAEVQEKFLAYRWPGQVRELRVTIDAACRIGKSTELQLTDLPLNFRAGQDAQRRQSGELSASQSLDERLHSYEVKLIHETLIRCEGNKTAAARLLGLTRPKLYRRMKSLGLETDD